MDPALPFIDDEQQMIQQMVYTTNAAYNSVSHELEFNTDNPTYCSVSREPNTNLPPGYSGVKIVPDSKGDGKEVVILPEKRWQKDNENLKKHLHML